MVLAFPPPVAQDSLRLARCHACAHTQSGTHVNATRESLVREHQVEAELEPAGIKPPLAAQNLFILEEACEAIAVILWPRGASSLRQRRNVSSLSASGGILEHAHKAMKGND